MKPVYSSFSFVVSLGDLSNKAHFRFKLLIVALFSKFFVSKKNFPVLIIEGLQYGFGKLCWRTKPRGLRKDFFGIFSKRPLKLIKFNF